MSLTPSIFTPRQAPIEAHPFTKHNGQDIADWCGGTAITEDNTCTRIDMVNEDGVAFSLLPGNYVVKDATGNITGWNATDFEDTYGTQQ